MPAANSLPRWLKSLLPNAHDAVPMANGAFAVPKDPLNVAVPTDAPSLKNSMLLPSFRSVSIFHVFNDVAEAVVTENEEVVFAKYPNSLEAFSLI